MDNELIEQLKDTIYKHEMTQAKAYDEECEAEESPCEDEGTYSLAHDQVVAKSPSAGITITGNSHAVTANPNQFAISNGSVVVNSNYVWGDQNTNVVNVNIKDPTDAILRDLRTTVQERQMELKKELEDLSYRYESAEQLLQELTKKDDELKQCIDALGTPEPVSYEVFDEDEEMPF